MSGDSELIEALAGVTLFIEATDCEQSYVWRMATKEAGRGWDQSSLGYGRMAGKFKGQEVWVSIQLARIDGQKVCFYHATSRFVDHNLVLSYIESIAPATAKTDGRLNHTDAMNCILSFKIPQWPL